MANGLHRGLMALAGVLSVMAVGCSDDSTDSLPTSTALATVPAGAGDVDRCVVRLHGKGGEGGDPQIDGRTVTIIPPGNGEGWGGRQWLYGEAEQFAEAVGVVTDALAPYDCERIVVSGFSNGGAFAAKLFCSGENLGGALVGVLVDDPVTDEGVLPCTPATEVAVALYWTGALADAAPPGTACADLDWTCDGDVVIGIDAFAAALGVTTQQSPFADHQPYWDAPEIADWLDA